MSPPPTSPPFEPKPAKGKVSEHSEKGTAEYKIWFIKIGENSGLVKTLYSDGTVTYTVTDGVEVGGTGGAPGAKINIGKLERGEKVDFGGGVKFDYGRTCQLSRPTGTPGMTLAPAATGPLTVVAVQTLVTWALWRLRHRP